MPICKILTNLPAKAIPKDLSLRLTNLLAEVLNKPLERITVNVQSDQVMMKNGTTESAAVAEIYALNVFNEDKCPDYGKQILPFLEQNLGIGKKRINLIFHPLQKWQLGDQ
ncbi:hypothetical protein CAPTEDRAFT_156850 [Capitella teleta]|uniref:D-dopachrome decarboxylase n=1 Tax=Capitella teleta TaxID=283909 RepID=R7TNA4_CAPTE|nr:hypothetical protein CAPTEDRAFT_156850 [Capitella teleta]|eukprot:ELT95313.1 hypothetical protein CAPTEDRAFT_156850 [Capitella teleta]